MNKIILVQEVDYDGGQLGRPWRLVPCINREVAAKVIKELTQPIMYHDGPREWVSYTHRNGTTCISGYLGPAQTFIFTKEVDVRE